MESEKTGEAALQALLLGVFMMAGCSSSTAGSAGEPDDPISFEWEAEERLWLDIYPEGMADGEMLYAWLAHESDHIQHTTIGFRTPEGGTTVSVDLPLDEVRDGNAWIWVSNHRDPTGASAWASLEIRNGHVKEGYQAYPARHMLAYIDEPDARGYLILPVEQGNATLEFVNDGETTSYFIAVKPLHLQFLSTPVHATAATLELNGRTTTFQT